MKMKRTIRPAVGNPNLSELGKPYRWKKGQAGNPNKIYYNGTKWKLSKIREDQLETLVINCSKVAIKICEHTGLDPEKTTMGALIVARNNQEALLRPNSRSADRLFDRVEGPVPQKINTEGNFKTINENVTDVKELVNKMSKEQKKELLGYINGIKSVTSRNIT